MSAGDDVLNIVAGTYTLSDEGTGGNGISINKAGTSGHPIIIQNNGYTGSFGTGDTVYVEGVKLTTSGWTQCTNCTTGICSGVPGTCSNVWYYVIDNVGSSRLYFARKPDGTITLKKTIATMTNQYDSAPSPQGAGWDGDSSNTMLVRWGPTVTNPNTTPGIGVNNYRADIMDVDSPANYVTIRGLTIRNGARQAVGISGTRTDVSIINNRIYNFNDSANGSARPIGTDGALNFLISGNEIYNSSSEPLHISTLTTGITTGTISNNYVHDIGNLSTLGSATFGTPNCTTFTNDSPIGSASPTGDFSGVVVDGNIFERCLHNPNGGSGSKGILFETACSGMQVSNNILKHVGSCFKFAPGYISGTNINNHKIFNNLCIEPGLGGSSGDGACFLFTGFSSGTMTNNSIYNNTCANPASGAVLTNSLGSITITGNLFRNNIFYVPSDIRAIDWPPTSSTNKFQNNIIYTEHFPAVSIRESSYSCGLIEGADFDADGNSDLNHCSDPGFYDKTSFLFYPTGGNSNIFPSSFLTNSQFGGPAIDMGTDTGNPAAHTTGIVNTLAAAHGFGFYSDSISKTGSQWDAGAVEAYVSYGGTPLLTGAGGPWTEFKPSVACSGTSLNAPSTIGGNAGIQFLTDKDPDVLCQGVSQPLTLTVGQDYLVQVKLSRVVDFTGVSYDGSTPAITTTDDASAADCSADVFDNWDIDATNATLTLLYPLPASGIPHRGTWAADGKNLADAVPRQYRLTPTSASVTLKLQVPAINVYTTCPDLVYTFSPIILFPEP